MLDALKGNLSPIDIPEAEKSLRGDVNILQDGEHVEMAFQCGRDRLLFTTKRMLRVDRQGLTGTRTAYESTPFKAIKAFAVETAGSVMDGDTELVLWTDLPRWPRVKCCFNKTSTSLFELHKLIMGKVFGAGPGGVKTNVSAASSAAAKSSSATVASWLTDDARQVDAKEMEASLKKPELPVLMPEEIVVLAFKSGRDTLVLTDRRWLKCDVQGLTGSRQEYLSIPYTSMHAFAVRTAGGFLDGDAELTVWTGLPTSTGMYEVQQDLRKGAADIFAVQQFLAGQVLGKLSAPPANLHAGTSAGKDDSSQQFLDWLGGDAASADPRAAEEMLRSTPTALLLPEETVEMAYRVRSDWLILTSLRMLCVDKMKVMMGLGGSKVEYKSLLYSAIGCFAVQSAGSLDRDAELRVWTDIYPPPEPGGDNPPPPPPGMAYISQDLRSTTANIFGISKLLTEKILEIDMGQVPQSGSGTAPTGSIEGGMLSWMGGDSRQMDPKEVEKNLRDAVPLLANDEHVTHAFKCGRDLLLFTPVRVLVVDVSGWSGKRVEYRTIAYKALRGFSVETAGTVDFDSELTIYTNLPWMAGIKQDIRKGGGNVFDIQAQLCKILLPQGVPAQSQPKAPAQKGSSNPFAKAAAFLGQNAEQIDAQETQAKLSSGDFPIMQPNEVAHLAFQVGRDTVVLTQNRMLQIDVQGLSGSKVEYKSIPWARVHAFSVTAAHNIDHHVTVMMDMPAFPALTFDLKKGAADIYEVQTSLAKSILG